LPFADRPSKVQRWPLIWSWRINQRPFAGLRPLARQRQTHRAGGPAPPTDANFIHCNDGNTSCHRRNSAVSTPG